MRVLTNILVWLGIVLYLVFSLGFISRKYNSGVCEQIVVSFTDNSEYNFISKTEVIDIILNSHTEILGYSLSKVNTKELEMVLEEEPFIRKAELYKTIDGTLNVDIVQPDPIIRLVSSSGKSCLIDRDGAVLPYHDTFASRILIANGNIPASIFESDIRSVFDETLGNIAHGHIIPELYSLASFISGHEVWSSHIAQVYINSKSEYEMIPRVGAHVIYLGDVRDLDKKFSKLQALYIYGFNNEGWNNYEVINLKYENQIICTKR